MADYLKDTNIKFLTIQTDDLEKINSEIENILKEAFPKDSSLQIEYVMRYDGLGIKRTDFEEIKNCFERAKVVERLVIQLRSKNLDFNNRKLIELKLDKDNLINSYLVVSDNNESWVDTKFKHLQSRLENYKNQNRFAHSIFFELFIQLVGIISGLLLTLIGSIKLAPIIPIQYSFFILFFSFFLIFSNLWSFILVQIRVLRNKLWEIISFKKKPMSLIIQAIISTIFSLILVWLLSISWNMLTDIGKGIIDK